MILRKHWHENKIKYFSLLSAIILFFIYHIVFIYNQDQSYAINNLWEQKSIEIDKIERKIDSKNSINFELQKGAYFDQLRFQEIFTFDSDPSIFTIELSKEASNKIAKKIYNLKFLNKSKKENFKDYFFPELAILFFISNHEISFVFIFITIMAIVFGRSFNNGSIPENQYPIYYPEEISGSMDDLFGIDDMKELIQEATIFLKNPDNYNGFGKTSPSNIMLSGPAGTGKSKIAGFIAKELNMPVIYASAGNLSTQYQGGGSISLKNIYSRAKKHKRCVIFLDEADIILKQRVHKDNESGNIDTINTLLSLTDGIISPDNQIFWIIASNFNSQTMKIDEAMERRFKFKLDFRLPNKKERKQIFDFYLSKVDKTNKDDDLNTEFMASITSNLSPAIIESIVDKAILMTIKHNNIFLENKARINNKFLYKAFEFITVGITNKETTLHLDEQRKIIATHEIGHFIVEYDYFNNKYNGNEEEISKHLNALSISTEAISRSNALGFVLSKEEELGLLNKSQITEKIKSLYGGLCAELHFYKEDGQTTGCENDLKIITDVLGYMISKVGMNNLSKLDYSQLSDSISRNQIYNEMTQLSEILFKDTQKIIKNNEKMIEYLTEKLVENYVLSKEEILEEIKNYKNISKKQVA